MDMLGWDHYHIPSTCEKCNGIMIFMGVGEYKCEECGYIAYDDYGKVRLYIETHPGANASEIEDKTGVTGRTIRRLIREERIEVAANSKVLITCEACGKDIRSGRFCPECEVKYHRIAEERERKRKTKIAGFGTDRSTGEEGERRFFGKDTFRR
jgi:DNA-directed RNA polymerase subunit M/transcription elongation factor TFIIS